MKAARLTDFDPKGALARTLGVEAEDLEGALVDGAGLAATVTTLDPAARAVLVLLLAAGGAAPADWLTTEAARLAGETSPAITRTLARLWADGLVARDRGSRTFFVPANLADSLVIAVGRVVFDILPEAPAPALPVLDEHALACTFHALCEAPPRLTREGRVHGRDLDALAARLAHLAGSSEPIAWTTLAVEALVAHGCVKIPAGGTLVPDRAAAARWAALTNAQRAEDLLTRRGETGLAARRLLAQLRATAPDREVPAELVALLHRAAAAQAGGFSAEQNDLQGPALEALTAAGLVSDVRGAVVLTAAGRGLAPAPPSPMRLGLGADLSILAPRGIPPTLHLAVGAIARLVSADVVATYRLDRERLLAALDRDDGRGADLEVVLSAAGPGVPAGVVAEVAQWRERFREVTTHDGVVVACSAEVRRAEFDAVVAAQVALRVRRVGLGIAVVAPEDHGALCDALAGAGFAVSRKRQVPAAITPAGSDPTGWPGAPLRPAEGDLALNEDVVAAWSTVGAAARGRRAAPPPREFLDRVKDKYRRDFGGAQVETLELLPLEELLEMEDRGRVRHYLSQVAAARPVAALSVRLEDYASEALIPVTVGRTRPLLHMAAAAGVTCQIAYLVRTGQRARLVVRPVEVVEETGGAWLRAVLPRTGEERLIALHLIHALRILAP